MTDNVKAMSLPAAVPTVLGSHQPRQEVAMRIGAVVIVIWLVIGVIAAIQRGYFSNAGTNCAKASNTVVTVVAGPLNYVGINPKIKCDVPQPSK